MILAAAGISCGCVCPPGSRLGAEGFGDSPAGCSTMCKLGTCCWTATAHIVCGLPAPCSLAVVAIAVAAASFEYLERVNNESKNCTRLLHLAGGLEGAARHVDCVDKVAGRAAVSVAPLSSASHGCIALQHGT
eukprot:97858-Chlamydomonas_euryale.AAC.3